MKMKKLNRKGFTLIELLAVIVILAVVMGIAANSVLNSMNNSRKSSLQNSALSAADSFRTAYAEYSMNPSEGLLGVTDTTIINNLLNGDDVGLDKFKDGLNITIGADGTKSNYLELSIVKFNKSNSTFTVCMFANPNGSYYLAAAVDASKTPTYVNGSYPATGAMWACSDNKNSWT